MGREEYPRPEFRRAAYLLLNGTWQFDWDDQMTGLDTDWMIPERILPQTIQVPFCFESPLSGIGDTHMHPAVCYKRCFTLPEEWDGKRILLHFEAVNYECRVFINGYPAGGHIGGHVGFSLDITQWVSAGENELSVWVRTPYTQQDIPRGKQFWEPQPRGVWYTRTSGIWQSVWLEPVSPVHLQAVRFTPNVDAGTVSVDGCLSQMEENLELDIRISFQGQLLTAASIAVSRPEFHVALDVFQGDCCREGVLGGALCWSPEHPRLLEVSLVLQNRETERDRVATYFGMRKIHTENGQLYLNNMPLYLPMVLDQGYWPDGLMTAPSDEDFRRDILMAKKLGFLGCRKHQKIEDRRFLYWADTLGFLVWEEMPACWVFSERSREDTMNELLAAVRRDYNHPSIIAWVPLNESWGVPAVRTDCRQQAYSLALYYRLKAEDSTRLVIGNDGWEQTATDVCTIHQYYRGPDEDGPAYREYAEPMADRRRLLDTTASGFPLFAQTYEYQGQPIMISEFGGIACCPHTTTEEAWGYTETDDPEQLLTLYRRAVKPILDSPCIVGFCYTQLTDVQQEKNGLLTEGRQSKCPPDKIALINKS